VRLINQLKDRFSSEADRVRRERERQRAEYVAILRRADNPQPGDEDRLEDLLKSLNLRVDQAEADAEKIKLIRERDQYVAALAEAREEQAEAREEAKAFNADAERQNRLKFNAGRDAAIKRVDTANRLVQEFTLQIEAIDRLIENEPWLVS